MKNDAIDGPGAFRKKTLQFRLVRTTDKNKTIRKIRDMNFSYMFPFLQEDILHLFKQRWFSEELSKERVLEAKTGSRQSVIVKLDEIRSRLLEFLKDSRVMEGRRLLGSSMFRSYLSPRRGRGMNGNGRGG